MTITPEIRRLIVEEIRKYANVVLSGQAGTNTNMTETIDNLYPGMPGMVNRPVMHPYGLVSAAPAKTISVTARQGDHTGNRIILGHRDANRPAVENGEVKLYNQFGQVIYLKNGSVHIGNAETQNPAVMGNEMKAFLLALLGWMKSHTHIITAPGTESLVPFQVADLEQIQAQNVDNDNILSQLIFLLKGG